MISFMNMNNSFVSFITDYRDLLLNYQLEYKNKVQWIIKTNLLLHVTECVNLGNL